MKKFILINILILSNLYCYSQDTPYKTITYPFLNQSENKIDFFGKSKNQFIRICSILNKQIAKGEGQLNVLQIGDSHIQADYFSGQMRDNLQTFALGIKGSRGFIFPYNVASTNNPENYKVKYTGTWNHCRNITEPTNCDLGISGISVTTYESDASIKIILNNHNYPHQDFNKVRIYHNNGDSCFNVLINENKLIRKTNNYNDYSEFLTDSNFDTLTILFQKEDSLQKSFTLHGIELSNDDPGIIYSAVGINGAEVNSFLKCNLLENQLKILNPQWIIISLGTNEAYSKNFNAIGFENNLKLLINRIKAALPNTFLLITTPPDSYRKKRFPNSNISVAKNVIIKVASENGCAVWDLYTVMGGFSSMKKWLNAGLAASDKIHFTRSGYVLQGDLFFNAFLEAYDKIIESGIKN